MIFIFLKNSNIFIQKEGCFKWYIAEDGSKDLNLKTLYKLYIALATQSSKIKYIFFLFVKSRAITLIKKKNIGVYNLEFKTQRNLKAKQTNSNKKSMPEQSFFIP